MMEGYAKQMNFPLAAIAGWPTGLWLIAGSLSIALGVWPDRDAGPPPPIGIALSGWPLFAGSLSLQLETPRKRLLTNSVANLSSNG
jgi:hypothetical protein